MLMSISSFTLALGSDRPTFNDSKAVEPILSEDISCITRFLREISIGYSALIAKLMLL